MVDSRDAVDRFGERAPVSLRGRMAAPDGVIGSTLAFGRPIQLPRTPALLEAVEQRIQG